MHHGGLEGVRVLVVRYIKAEPKFDLYVLAPIHNSHSKYQTFG